MFKYYVLSQAKHNKLYNYKLKGHNLQRVATIKDLGVIQDSGLIFDSHINIISTKASKALGFIMRISKEFESAKTIKILYCAYVRSNLEYASQVWNPMYNVYVSRLEKIQRRFVRFLNYKFKSNLEYTEACCRHHLLPLVKRREMADVIYLYKIVTGLIDCPQLLSAIRFNIPVRTNRYQRVFLISSASTNYRRNSYLQRVCDNLNKLVQHVDIDLFNTSISSLRSTLYSYFFGTG